MHTLLEKKKWMDWTIYKDTPLVPHDLIMKTPSLEIPEDDNTFTGIIKLNVSSDHYFLQPGW